MKVVLSVILLVGVAAASGGKGLGDPPLTDEQKEMLTNFICDSEGFNVLAQRLKDALASSVDGGQGKTMGAGDMPQRPPRLYHALKKLEEMKEELCDSGEDEGSDSQRDSGLVKRLLDLIRQQKKNEEEYQRSLIGDQGQNTARSQENPDQDEMELDRLRDEKREGVEEKILSVVCQGGLVKEFFQELRDKLEILEAEAQSGQITRRELTDKVSKIFGLLKALHDMRDKCDADGATDGTSPSTDAEKDGIEQQPKPDTLSLSTGQRAKLEAVLCDDTVGDLFNNVKVALADIFSVPDELQDPSKSSEITRLLDLIRQQKEKNEGEYQRSLIGDQGQNTASTSAEGSRTPAPVMLLRHLQHLRQKFCLSVVGPVDNLPIEDVSAELGDWKPSDEETSDDDMSAREEADVDELFCELGLRTVLTNIRDVLKEVFGDVRVDTRDGYAITFVIKAVTYMDLRCDSFPHGATDEDDSSPADVAGADENGRFARGSDEQNDNTQTDDTAADQTVEKRRLSILHKLLQSFS